MSVEPNEPSYEELKAEVERLRMVLEYAAGFLDRAMCYKVADYVRDAIGRPTPLKMASRVDEG